MQGTDSVLPGAYIVSKVGAWKS